ncbi:DUF3703 domain-containing protein [Streptomyces sp. NBC_00503]|uniref:DUF3703 domain-containing protein n=1 Tax=Streptomyces sp. NBC_00503 TaxID=2903659 RepID=UPI002E814CCE|nr:DUF3703 domain-containing protein [Streptomyces sp. NBC_00503]WUD83526.1 DUF3703 domain-containing protein [Streptomyces sp. NBC_00503]
MTNLMKRSVRTCVNACTGKRRAMPETVREAFEAELDRARGAVPDTAAMWTALERAHILSQAWAWPHTRAHWHMFRLAVRCRDRAEAAGQVVRILVAGVGSATGRVPHGNTGRTSAGLLTPMPVPPDLRALLGRTDLPVEAVVAGGSVEGGAQ